MPICLMCNGYIYAIPESGGVANQTQINADYTYYDEDGNPRPYPYNFLDTGNADIATDNKGNVYVSAWWTSDSTGEEGDSTIRKLSGGTWSRFGTMTSDGEENIWAGGIAVKDNSLYHVQDAFNDQFPMVGRYSLDGSLIEGVGGEATWGAAIGYSAWTWPNAVYGGYMYFMDHDEGGMKRVRLSDGATEYSHVWWDINPTDFDIDPTTGNIWAIVYLSNETHLREYDFAGNEMRRFVYRADIAPHYLDDPKLITFSGGGRGYMFLTSQSFDIPDSFGVIVTFTSADTSTLYEPLAWWDWSQPFGPITDSNVMNGPQGMDMFPVPVRRLQTISGGTGS